MTLTKLHWLLACVLAAAACDRAPAPLAHEFDGHAAFAYLQQQVAFGPRIPGTEGHRREAAWLDSLLRARADTLVVQHWTHRTRSGDSLELTNFIARFNPSATRRVLYLAHWDTRPRSTEVHDSPDSLTPVPGANDGASGVAVLLGLADVLKKTPPDIGVDLLFVDGEDYGLFDDQQQDVLIGSRYFAQHALPGAQPRFAVLWDMVGDRDLRIWQESYSTLGAPDVVELVWQTAADLGFRQYFVPEVKHAIIDDHISLQKAGIPAIDVLDFDYPFWHTPQDTIDKVSPQSLQVVGDVAAGVVRRAGKWMAGR